MVPGAHVFLPAVTLFTAVRLCVCFLSAVHGVRGGGGAHWGVGQLADRPAVNREVGGSSPPAPALDEARSRAAAIPPSGAPGRGGDSGRRFRRDSAVQCDSVPRGLRCSRSPAAWRSCARGRLDFTPGLGSHAAPRSEEHTSELQSRLHLVCRLLLEKKKDENVSAPLVPNPSIDSNRFVQFLQRTVSITLV